jgi:23S rRNA (cytosine1962-C5)-methyltransferase
VARDDYALLDCGGGRKLERLGGLVLDRPVAHAVWAPALEREAWERADGVYHRSDKGGGSWLWRGKPPAPFELGYGGLRLLVKATPFGHLGLFPEQRDNWDWLRAQVGRLRGGEVLNLFAYTGGSTLACAGAGAPVCHVDSSKGVVGWARDNAARSGLAEAPVRWIVEDAVAFLGREVRRGRRYQGVILDPPSYGRGGARPSCSSPATRPPSPPGWPAR